MGKRVWYRNRTGSNRSNAFCSTRCSSPSLDTRWRHVIIVTLRPLSLNDRMAIQYRRIKIPSNLGWAETGYTFTSSLSLFTFSVSHFPFQSLSFFLSVSILYIRFLFSFVLFTYSVALSPYPVLSASVHFIFKCCTTELPDCATLPTHLSWFHCHQPCSSRSQTVWQLIWKCHQSGLKIQKWHTKTFAFVWWKPDTLCRWRHAVSVCSETVSQFWKGTCVTTGEPG